MGLFSNLFKQKVGSESKSTIEKLTKWEQEHFPNKGYRYNMSTGEQHTVAGQYSSYRKEMGEMISLAQIPLPQSKKPESKSIFKKFKDWLEPEGKPMLPFLIAKYRNDLSKEIRRFRENLIKLDKLSDNLKGDSFFKEIDHMFNAKLRILYNELLFCKFENLGNAEYFNKIHKKLTSLHQDMNSLNRNTAL